MASTHIERAILRLQDDTSAKARKINSELRKLHNTMKAMKKIAANPIAIKADTRGLIAATKHVERLRKSAAKPITVTTISRGTPSASNAPVSQPRGSGGRRGGIFGTVKQFAIASATFHVASAVINAVSQGSRDRDIADEKIDFANLGDKGAAELRKISAQIAANNRGFNQSQIAQSILEVAPTTGFDIAEAAKGIQATLPLAQKMIRLGVDSERAIDDTDRIVRTLATTGQITKDDGTLDTAKLGEFVNVMQQVQGTMGKQFDASLFEQVVKRAQSAKLTLDPEGLRGLLIFGEELRAQAGVGLNQAIKNLTGRTTKEALANQAALGLSKTREVEVGKVGGKKSTERVFAGTENERLLRENIFEWVRSTLLPKVEGQQIDAIPQLAELGKFDSSDPVHAAKLAQSITSNRSAITLLTSAITRAAELERDVEVQKEQFDLSPAARLRRNEASQLLNMADAQVKVTDAIGTLVNAFEGPLIGAMNKVADIAQSISTFISAGDPEGKSGRAGLVAGGGILAGGAAIVGVKKLLNSFGLKTSATALNLSATNLNTAAAALTRAAAVQGGGNIGAGTGSGSSNKGNNKPSSGRGGKLLGLGAAITAVPLAQEVGKTIGEAFNSVVLGMTDEQVAAQRIRSDEAERRTSRAIIDGITRAFTSAPGATNIRKNVAGSDNTIESSFASAGIDPRGIHQIPMDIETAMGSGATTIQTTMATSAQEFGPAAGNGIMPFARQFGAQAGAAFSENAKVAAPSTFTGRAPDTGKLNVTTQ